MTGFATYKHFIDGAWVAPAGAGMIESIDPYRGEPWALIARGNAEDAERAVASARKAFVSGSWPALNATQRGALLRRLGDLIARDAERLATIETHDNGKLLAEMRAQVRYVPEWFHYFGGLADKIQGSVLPSDKADMFNFTRYEPLGVVVALTAWNSPLLLAAYKLAPALAAGNTVVLKPSEHASVSSLELMNLVNEAGFPPGVVNLVTGYGPEVGEALINHRDVAKIALTGGHAAGEHVRKAAARGAKGVLLELGGKSPNIVFEDADLEAAINGVLSGIFAASGQTCVAGSRLMLHESIHDTFVERLIARTREIKVGDPADAGTQMGPVTTRQQFNHILNCIDIAKNEGAQCRFGGKAALVAGAGGCFVEPTIFTGVTNTMRIAREEVFGPVLAVLKFRDEAEAIAIANDTPFGLAAGVWTKDIARAFRMSQALQAGTVWVNTYRAVSFMSPFGGYKASGTGRENGADAIKEYLQVKSVWMSTAQTVANPFIIR